MDRAETDRRLTDAEIQAAAALARRVACRTISTSTREQRMTKHQLAKQVAADAGLSGEQAKSAIDAVFNARRRLGP